MIRRNRRGSEREMSGSRALLTAHRGVSARSKHRWDLAIRELSQLADRLSASMFAKHGESEATAAEVGWLPRGSWTPPAAPRLAGCPYPAQSTTAYLSKKKWNIEMCLISPPRKPENELLQKRVVFVTDFDPHSRRDKLAPQPPQRLFCVSRCLYPARSAVAMI